jgi:hypothetical protein
MDNRDSKTVTDVHTYTATTNSIQFSCEIVAIKLVFPLVASSRSESCPSCE